MTLQRLAQRVIPAKAGIHENPLQTWTPAYAGVTDLFWTDIARQVNKLPSA